MAIALHSVTVPPVKRRHLHHHPGPLGRLLLGREGGRWRVREEEREGERERGGGGGGEGKEGKDEERRTEEQGYIGICSQSIKNHYTCTANVTFQHTQKF